ncbi:ABC transporter permease [Streptomyces sp. NPDC054841]
MSATGESVRGAEARAATTAVTRLTALGRAELTLMGRNTTALFMALVMPIGMTFAMRQSVKGMPLSEHGLSAGTVLLPAAVGLVLLFGVYTTLTQLYVVRREELVLKRLRAGEPTDPEILTGAALPIVLVALAQCVLLAACGGLLLDAELPRSPLRVLLGVVLGILLSVVLAAISAAVTRTAEAAGLTTMPLLLGSLAGSGLIVPLEVMPDRLASVLELLPMSPVVSLVRDGWTGAASGTDTLRQVAVALVWTALGVFAVRRWFRWEPRR